MNNISEQLLTAIEVITEEAVRDLKYDKTVQAEVYSIVNLDTGEYKVKYMSNVFSAFASDLTVSYKVGDIVYVNIPEGDFSSKKMINSKVSSSSLSYGQMISLANSIVEVSPSLDKLYNYDASAEYGVVAGAPPDSALSHTVIFESNIDDYHGLFAQYAKQYELIRIQGSFLTAFHNDHIKGNYGLRLEFFTKNEDIISYSLDLSSFIGDPYSLSVYSPQSIIIKAQLGYLTGIKSISLFEENFDYDRYVKAGLVTDNQNTTIPNIFVKDMSIQFVQQQDLTDNLYYLQIGTPQGNSFTSTITSLDLVGRLIYEGENILNDKTCKCAWYIRDLSVTTGSEAYDTNAGITWRKLESTSFDRLNLKTADVGYQNEYKLVVIYNENVVISAEITIFNLTSTYSIELTQITEGEQIQLQISDNLVGDWYLQYPDGSYTQFAYKANKVDVTDRLLYSFTRFYCAVYDTNKEKVIANLQHLITNAESEEDVTITYDGEDIFRYDANGDITIEDSEKERTLQVILTWKDGVGTSYKVEWAGPDGEKISTSRYSPEYSMMENLWVDSNNILHYNLKQKYRMNFNNNSLTVKVITIDGQEYNFNKEILFIKDGDQGTNGTTYITTIRPFDSDTNLKLSGLNPLIYRNGNWQNSLNIKCYVYKDGELINDQSNYTLTYRWTAIGVTLTDGATNYQKMVNGSSVIIGSNPIGAYVKVEVSINDKMNGQFYSIYCSYPVDVAYGFSNEEIRQININSIPSYIKYTASGINPSFYNNDISFLYKDIDYSDNIASLTPHLLTLTERDELTYLKPASSFTFEDNSIALLKCIYNSSMYLLHPIMLYLDTYGNEAINGWDGTSLKLNEKDGYLYAPQIGAGEKDSYNRFTGVVMGKDSQQEKVGLYGYQNGTNTFGLMQDGKAFFGSKTGGGQILIDGEEATIQGGGGGDSANGMTITLANRAHSGEAIKLGAGNFKVTYDGTLTAKEANIQGTIYAEKGYIGGLDMTGGWTIENGRLSSGSGNTYVALDSSTGDYTIWAGGSSANSAPFSVTRNGDLTAESGTIGGWTIESNKLNTSSGNVGLAPNGSYAFWAGSSASNPKFSVTHSGVLTAEGATIEGNVTAIQGTIGGWEINGNRLHSGSNTNYVALDSDTNVNYAIWAGNSSAVSAPFSVTKTGALKAISGSIGGWTINSNSLVAGSEASIKAGSDFIVTGSGQLTAKNANITGTVTATSGTIGGWTIDGNFLVAASDVSSIKAGDFRVDGTGYIQASYGIIGSAQFSGNGVSIENRTGGTSAALNIGNKITINSDGNAYFGNWSILSNRIEGPESAVIRIGKLTISSSDSLTSIIPDSSGTIGEGRGLIGNESNPWLSMRADTVHAKTIDETSSRKIKKNILPLIEKDYNNIDKLEPITYELKQEDSKKRYLGLIAEDVYKYCPMLVTLNENNEPAGISYSRLTVILLYELQKLRKRVSTLEREKGDK